MSNFHVEKRQRTHAADLLVSGVVTANRIAAGSITPVVLTGEDAEKARASSVDAHVREIIE